MKRFYDRTSQRLRELMPGKLMFMYDPAVAWQVLVIVPISFAVEVNGFRYRRNRPFLRTI